MGVGGFLWGWLYDRYGACVVVLFGGLLQGLGLAAASQAQSLPMFLVVYGTAAGLAAGAVYVPLTAATASWFVRHQPRRFPCLGRSGAGYDAGRAARTLADRRP